MRGFGAALIALRGKKSQREVAQAVGISIQAISAYENEERIPKDEVKVRLATYFDRPVAEIFYPQDHEKWCNKNADT